MSRQIRLGCHISSAGGFAKMAKTAHSIDANTFQFFTRNPRGSKAKVIDPLDSERFRQLCVEYDLRELIAHSPYTLNLCAKRDDLREFAIATIKDDLQRLNEHAPGQYYNLHPGNHVGQGVEQGIELIAEGLRQVLPQATATFFLLETMAGMGTEVGAAFTELREIIDRVAEFQVGICLDTCHVYAAGYDIVNQLDQVLTQFDDEIGLAKLKAVHLNDCKSEFGSNVDRHAKIGEGTIGLEAIVRIINHPALCHLPFVLETPNELPGYQAEIELLCARYQSETP